MTAKIPDTHRDILDSKAIAHLATLMPDGRPQVTPVWFDFDGAHVRVNSTRGRRKDRNMRRDARVALSMCDVENPYRYLEVRGTIVEITEQGADEHIDALAMKYLGEEKYPHRVPGDVRVIYKVAPESFSSQG